jgi:arylsulfatase A-like enzyme
MKSVSNPLRRRRALPRPFVCLLLLLLLLLLSAALPGLPLNAAPAAPPAPRPNILVILADDQGWGDLSLSGNTNLATPRIDALARAGASFERFYVCPVCSPTRAEFLTGRYHPRGGVWNVSTGGERMNLDERTIADAFRAAGYATGCFGKWHNGTQYPYHPIARGFDEYYGFTSGHWGIYFDPPLDHNGQLVQGRGFIVDDLADHAMQFIEQTHAKGRQPFFCYLAANVPHTPAQVPDRFYEKFAAAPITMRAGKGERIEKTRAILAMCENLDWNVGRVLDKLDELKLADDTIVVYFSDNGPNTVRWNGGMRGIKGSVDEGGVRSPLAVRWPGHVRAGMTVRPIAAAIDLLPTLADLAGVPLAPAKPLDGVSLAPLLVGEAAKPWPAADRMIFSHWGGKVSVRTQQYRLDAAGRLYDMEADPGQEQGVAAAHPDVAERLRKAVADWRGEVLSQLNRDSADRRPFPIGYAALPMTQLPARDGVPHGNVRRSAAAPNCSYFTNWTSPEDRITWDVEVATAGRYEAVVYYTCPAADAGASVELSLNDSRATAKVAEAFDPPLRGAEHDRFPREGESYVKDFKPLGFGPMELKAGRGLLTLRAVEVPGKRVMDVRMVVLTLVTGK